MKNYIYKDNFVSQITNYTEDSINNSKFSKLSSLKSSNDKKKCSYFI